MSFINFGAILLDLIAYPFIFLLNLICLPFVLLYRWLFPVKTVDPYSLDGSLDSDGINNTVPHGVTIYPGISPPSTPGTTTGDTSDIPLEDDPLYPFHPNPLRNMNTAERIVMDDMRKEAGLSNESVKEIPKK